MKYLNTKYKRFELWNKNLEFDVSLERLKEQTGLSTKDMRLAMKWFRDLYFLEKEFFYSDD